MQISSGSSIAASQALFQAAQLSGATPGPSSPSTTTQATTTPSTKAAALAPRSKLLSSSLTQALIDSTQVQDNTAATTNSTTTADSNTPPTAKPASGPSSAFFGQTHFTVTDSKGNVLQPINFWSNVTQGDLSTLDATFGLTQVAGQDGATETLASQGQPVSGQTLKDFQQLGAVI